MLKTFKSLKIPALIIIGTNNAKVIVKSGLKPNLFKSKITKMT